MASNYPPGVTGNEPEIAGDPYGRCDSCGAVLEDHGHQRGDLVVCDVCRRKYDKDGHHLPAKPK